MLDTLFLVCNASVMPFWLLLIVLPRARVTRLLVHGPVIALLLGLVYGVGLLTMPPVEGGSFSTLTGVTRLLGSPQGALIGWVHYLIFDLFIGAWQARDAQRRGIAHLALCPCLLLTLMLGPLGLLAYLTLRAALQRRLSFDEGYAGSRRASVARDLSIDEDIPSARDPGAEHPDKAGPHGC